MNWEHYRTALARGLSNLDLKYKSVAELEQTVELVGQAIRLAYQSSCSLKVPKGKQGTPWWSQELQRQHAEVRRDFYRSNFTGRLTRTSRGAISTVS